MVIILCSMCTPFLIRKKISQASGTKKCSSSIADSTVWGYIKLHLLRKGKVIIVLWIFTLKMKEVENKDVVTMAHINKSLFPEENVCNGW